MIHDARTDRDTVLEQCPPLQPLLDWLDDLNGRADLERLGALLGDLRVTPDDLAPWRRFADENYNRNLIRRTPWYDMLLICWRGGQASPIHDHYASTCGFRVIEGTVTENRFTWTGEDLEPGDTLRHEPGRVATVADEGIHEVRNDVPGTEMVTLHVYSPALLRFHTYTRDDGRAVQVMQSSAMEL